MENSKAVSAAISVELTWPEMSTPQSQIHWYKQMKIYFIRDMHGMWYVEHNCVWVETKNDNRAKD